MKDEPYLSDPDVTLYQGDALDVLRRLPDRSVHMCATSPPFYGLRDYGVEGQIGLEESPDEWAARLVEVFREVRRVLRDDGTLWVEIGDSYAARGYNCGMNSLSRPWQATRQKGWRPAPRGMKNKDLIGQPWLLAFALRAGFSSCSTCNREQRNDLWPVLNGHRVCIDCLAAGRRESKVVLTEPGWYLRSEIIWHRPNPMPESVTDRPTKAHSTIFLLSKSPRYFYDQEAIREPYAGEFLSTGVRNPRYGRPGGQMPAQTSGTVRVNHYQQNARTMGGDPSRLAYPGPSPPQAETLAGLPPETPRGPDGRRVTTVKAGPGSIQHRDGERWPASGANARSVWTIPTEPTSFGICRVCDAFWPSQAPQTHCGERTVSHFATWPQDLARRMILAGTSERGVCPECGAPWVRETSAEYVKSPKHGAGSIVGPRNAGLTNEHLTGGRASKAGLAGRPRVNKTLTTLGWRPTCWCGHERGPDGEFGGGGPPKPVPAVVLDPFAGSGTTLLVARKLGRHAIGIELSPDYCRIASGRLAQQSLLAVGA